MVFNIPKIGSCPWSCLLVLNSAPGTEQVLNTQLLSVRLGWSSAGLCREGFLGLQNYGLIRLILPLCGSLGVGLILTRLEVRVLIPGWGRSVLYQGSWNSILATAYANAVWSGFFFGDTVSGDLLASVSTHRE